MTKNKFSTKKILKKITMHKSKKAPLNGESKKNEKIPKMTGEINGMPIPVFMLNDNQVNYDFFEFVKSISAFRHEIDFGDNPPELIKIEITEKTLYTDEELKLNKKQLKK